MRVLVACEFSGIVRDAFLRRGHDALSCDLLPTESPGPHYQGRIEEFLTRNLGGFDLLIAFPPCTHLSSSGARYWPEKKADGRQQESIDFVLWLATQNIQHIAIENPVGILSRAWRKPDQIIQPYMFGDPVTKKTCLWLKNLPALVPTHVVAPRYAFSTGSKWGGARKDGTRKLNPLKCLHRSGKQRSIFHPGIAAAMAEQWEASCS